MLDLNSLTTPRRGFLGRLAAGAAALGLGGLVAPAEAAAERRVAPRTPANPEFEAWLNKMTGKHKMLYDMPEPNSGFGFAWARIFLNTTNETYGTTDAENTVVIVLRHNAIPFGMKSDMWPKYKLGEAFKINDAATNAAAARNPFAYVKPGDLPFPGMAVDELVAKGVLFEDGNAGRDDKEGLGGEPAARRAGSAVRRDRDQSRAGERLRVLLCGMNTYDRRGAACCAPTHPDR